MRPYEKLARAFFAGSLLLVSLVGVPVNAARGPAQQQASEAAAALARAGFDLYYSGDYAAAVRNFERAAELEPRSPRALNHLYSALLFSELYRTGVLNSSLYSSGSNSFLGQKRPDVQPEVKARLKDLSERSLRLSNERLGANADDVESLYSRGAMRGLQATYQGLVERAWFAALRSAIGARHDHERVLQLDPTFADAKTVLGVHNYVAGNLPFMVRAAISVVGLSGNKEKGLRYLQEAAAAGGETADDARVALALFLRRERRYDDALAVVTELGRRHPRNFLFALEAGHVLRDSGRQQQALEAYRALFSQASAGRFSDPHLELAHFGIAEILRARRQYEQAAEHYENARRAPAARPEVQQAAALSAGEMYDLLSRRDRAREAYEIAIASDSDSPLAQVARQRLKEPYRER